MSEQFLRRLALPLRRWEDTEIQKLALADGKPVNLLGKVEITIKINGLSIPVECRVLPNLAYDLILGLDIFWIHCRLLAFGSFNLQPFSPFYLV